MKNFCIIEHDTIIEKTTTLFGLKLKPGARLLPPEGKMLTMTYHGEQVDPNPGTYEGEIVLTITEPISVGTMTRSDLRTALCVGENGVNQKKSVMAALQQGKVQGNVIDNLQVTSLGSCFSALYLSSNQDYVLNRPHIVCIGNGDNESVGEGAGIIAAGSGKLTINDADIFVHGAARSAIFGGGKARLEINDSKIKTMGGVLPYDYEDSIAAGKMKRVPWMLGLRGNSRATNLAEHAEAVYNRCTILAREWGAMSTDGVEHCRLTLNDSHIQVTGKSGYGTFALMDTVNTLNHCTVNVPDYGVIVANGPASTVITGGTEIRAGRFGVMCFRNTSGKITVNDGSFIESGEATFMVKGCSTAFEVEDAVLRPTNGVILQVMDTDDPRHPQKYFSDNVEPDCKNPDRDLTKGDVVAVFRNMELKGKLFNSTSNKQHDTGPDFGDPHGPPPSGNPGGPAGPKPEAKTEEPAKNLQIILDNVRFTGEATAATAKHLVHKIDKYNCEELGRIKNSPAPAVNNSVIIELKNGTIWTVTGPCYLTKVTLDSVSKITSQNGSVKLSVNGRSELPAPGTTYVGSIMIEPE